MNTTNRNPLYYYSYFQYINEKSDFVLKPISYKVLITGKSFAQGSSTCVLLAIPFNGSINYFLYDTGTSYDRDKLLVALKECNLTPNDIDCIILSHWHIDHIGNADLFPNALFIASSETFDVIQNIQSLQDSKRNSDAKISEYFIKLLKKAGISYTSSKIRAVTVLTQKHQTQIKSISDSYVDHKAIIIQDERICFDNAMCIYKANTHTDGDIVIKIRCANQTILITGDFIINSQEYCKQLNSIRKLGIQDQDIVIPGHDTLFQL